MSWNMCHFAYLHSDEASWKPEHWRLICRGAALNWWLVRLPITLAGIALMLAVSP
jgi:hypothetical protein